MQNGPTAPQGRGSYSTMSGANGQAGGQGGVRRSSEDLAGGSGGLIPQADPAASAAGRGAGAAGVVGGSPAALEPLLQRLVEGQEELSRQLLQRVLLGQEALASRVEEVASLVAQLQRSSKVAALELSIPEEGAVLQTSGGSWRWAHWGASLPPAAWVTACMAMAAGTLTTVMLTLASRRK
jgi:hypothetical protein